MKRRTFLSMSLVPAILSPVAMAAPESIAAAQAAGRAWLQSLDAGDYPATWESAATIFKSAVSREDWLRTSQAVRRPLGAVRSRTDRSTIYAKSLPGAPDGEYVVMQFDTTFEHKALAVETVTAELERDGAWRVAGYFIR